MNKALKELIAKCEPYVDGTPFSSFYVIPSGKSYDELWGKNGFNQIYIICRNGDKFYLVSGCQCDVLNISPLRDICAEVPSKLNILSFWSRKMFVIKYSNTSTITIEEVQEK